MNRKVKLIHLLFYGSGNLFGGGSLFIVGTLYMFYLTEVIGVAPWMAGVIFGVGKVLDAIFDPLMGYISDQTHSKRGRRRPYFLVGIGLVPLSFFLMWVPVNFTYDLSVLIYYAFAYIFFNLVYTFVMVPYSAINAEMTYDYHDRNRLSGTKMIFSEASVLLSATLPNLIIKQYSANPEWGYLLMAILFSLFYGLPWLFVYLGTWELPYQQVKERFSMKQIMENFRTILKNRSFRIHIGMYIFTYSALDTLAGLFIYYVTYYLNMSSYYPLFMGVLMITQISMLPVYVMISNKKSNAFAYVMGLSIWAFSMILMFFLSPHTPVVVILLICVVIGLGLAGGVMIPWAILPYVTDVDEIISAKKRAGIYAGAMTLSRKFVQGLIVAPLLGTLLSLIGYIENIDHKQVLVDTFHTVIFFGLKQPPSAITNIHYLIVGLPLLLLIVGIYIGSQFKINPKSHSILMAEIDRLKQGGKKEDVDEKVREICEKLTGLPYESLYPLEKDKYT